MPRSHLKVFALALAVAALALAASGCGRERGESAADAQPATGAAGDLSGRILSDGSSTVGPVTTAAAELFQAEHPDVRIEVGISGTGGGFERFCAGEIDLSNASRPIKEDEEVPLCEESGVEFTEFQVATDALTVVVNPENDWVECITVEQLNTIWAPEAEGEVTSWSQVDPAFPDQRLVLAGPGTDSGTFDYFTDEVNGEEGASRADYTASEDDNVIVQAVAGDAGGLGYFGLSYYLANEDKLKAVAVENEDGECIEPSVETAESGAYNPLARPLFIYVNNEALARPEVQEFIRFIFDRNAEIAETALYIPLNEEQLAEERRKLEEVTGS